METSCLIQEPQKKQKLNEEDEDIDGNSKCLSDLPEEILRHILSFLPTKHAVRTSVLSKRWEYLWASIPNLDFKRSLPTYFNGPIEKYKSKRRLLMNFVERVLCLRDSYAIKRFTLPCDVLGDAARVNTWISAVVRHNVQELNIYLDKFKGEFSLPYCLFTYEYLTQHLFSGLPVLKKLSLTDCSWGGLKVVCISAPKLHSLSIWESERPDSSYGDGCEVLIFAVRLKEFEYSGELFINYCLNNSFSLEKAEITVFSNNTSAQVAHRMYKLLIGLSNVKLLQLSCAVVEVLIDAAEHLLHMPMFNNLTDLILYDGYWSVALDSVLLRILHKSPCLETLKFWKGIRLWENDDWILDPVPPCFLSHVKWIEVGDYDGDREEFSAVKILLKNAVVLNEIVIFCSVHLRGNLEKQENLYKQLIEIPKGSRNCKIVLK
ncbi:F-box/LRR-repeat protein At3g58900-like isoform X2 [Corylus avellana]|uniref:F-box/LRR-repeat protein At3g58900-like isoform X2 n=1 Tax=Corylus avellana TaxID=13451 RepID=UPI00286BA153|nr:F-box/LRR-repeat protein At3g58900-like isoform X2 [Corylus avellana]